jgi:hypothetical protein
MNSCFSVVTSKPNVTLEFVLFGGPTEPFAAPEASDAPARITEAQRNPSTATPGSGSQPKRRLLAAGRKAIIAPTKKR